MSNVHQPAVGRSSQTFEWSAGFPFAHMPSFRLADSNLTVPGHASELLDGEWLLFNSDKRLVRPAGNDEGLTTNADPARLGISAGALPGSSYRQASRMVPYITDVNAEFRTRLITSGIVAGSLCEIVIDDVELDGHTYTDKTLLSPVTAATHDGYVLAICTVAPDTAGWATFRRVFERLTAPA